MYFQFEKEDKSLNVRPEACSEHIRIVFIWALKELHGFPRTHPLDTHLLKPQKLTLLERLRAKSCTLSPFPIKRTL